MIALCGSSNITFTCFSPFCSILAFATFEEYLVFTSTSIGSFISSINNKLISVTLTSFLYNSLSSPTITSFLIGLSPITNNGTLYEIPSPFLCPIV